MVANRVRVPTTYPLSPQAFCDTLVKLVAPLPACDRVSMGFPGVVRSGVVLQRRRIFRDDRRVPAPRSQNSSLRLGLALTRVKRSRNDSASRFESPTMPIFKAST